ncbi:MAG: phosphoribosylglycinamide formyltransferase [Bdellovibrionales bacterium]|nr:phosphoribosylglycinamide formyltransferase [Bdellovibrionales bacterium]
MKPRLAFLCSGEGTTFKYLAEQAQFQAVCLITNTKKAPVLKKAQNLNISSFTICPHEYPSTELWDEAVLKCLENKSIDLVILAGFLCRVGPLVLSSFKNKVINSHPALLPKFGGQGMYGIHVHKAVLQAQGKTTGVTIHYVNEEYDKGTIIAQKKINVLDNDTPEILEERVKKIEKAFYAEVIEQIWKKQNER